MKNRKNCQYRCKIVDILCQCLNAFNLNNTFKQCKYLELYSVGCPRSCRRFSIVFCRSPSIFFFFEKKSNENFEKKKR